MKKVMNYIFKNRLLIYIIINILYLLIGSFFATMNFIDGFKLHRGFIFVLLPLNIIVAIIERKKFKKDIIYLFMASILLFAVISTIFAYNKDTAIYGISCRNEGLLMILYYLSIFYLSSLVGDKDKKKIAYAIIGVGIVEIIFALFEKFALFNVPLYVNLGYRFAYGLAVNPNFLAELVLLGLCYLLGFFFESNKKSIIYYILILFFMMGLMLTNTLSCVAGLFIVFIFLIIYSIKHKTIKKLLLVFLGFVSVFVVLRIFKLTTINKAIDSFKEDTINVAKGSEASLNNYGSGRIYVWREAIKEVPKYLLTGIGIDNFYYIKDGKPIQRNLKAYDKAHNEYLQYLTTGGIFYLLSYIAFYSVIVYRSFKNKKLYLLLPIIGYLVQAFFNISVIQVAPLFFITLGLSSIKNRSKKEDEI